MTFRFYDIKQPQKNDRVHCTRFSLYCIRRGDNQTVKCDLRTSVCAVGSSDVMCVHVLQECFAVWRTYTQQLIVAIHRVTAISQRRRQMAARRRARSISVGQL